MPARHIGRLAVTSLAILIPGAFAVAQDVPQYGDAVHLGVASCASSTCHGAVDALAGTTVLQNEYATWQKRDKHADAYTVLLNDESARIARNLGIDDPTQADICLDCHADNVPADKRGPRFQISDGVGCESCHGGADGWISAHTTGEGRSQHANNLSLGLFPSEDPAARAELCVSCHLGDRNKLATHRIMGAGHPRLSFELDTFTAIQPAHYAMDDDYFERKNVANGAKTWAIGQAVALSETLDLLRSDKYGKTGLFPELFFFDCHACHKPMSAARWQERASLGLGPGVVRFNDANLIMLRIAAAAVDKGLAERIAKGGRALHKASQQSAKAGAMRRRPSMRRSARRSACSRHASSIRAPCAPSSTGSCARGCAAIYRLCRRRAEHHGHQHHRRGDERRGSPERRRICRLRAGHQRSLRRRREGRAISARRPSERPQAGRSGGILRAGGRGRTHG
ncbi:MAG: multiheme c-type cytochrome [Geminicoccaceae bacterium]